MPATDLATLRVGTRRSPLALIQTRGFMAYAADAARHLGVFEEVQMQTTGDAVQDRKLAEIGGKGLFAKEIHEALLDRRIDLAVHSLKDLETSLPDGIVLGCVLAREDARDVLLVGPGRTGAGDGVAFGALPMGAVVGTSSVRRQAQLLHARPDLSVTMLRGNVQTRLGKLADGVCDASLLALAGLNRLGMAHVATMVLDPEVMVPSAAQGIVGITCRADDSALCALLADIEDRAARVAATAERAMLGLLDGSCRTPIGGHARLLDGDAVRLTGLVARADGSFLLKRSRTGSAAEARALGEDLAAELRRDSPSDVFA